jgi:hypothetical protein
VAVAVHVTKLVTVVSVVIRIVEVSVPEAGIEGSGTTIVTSVLGAAYDDGEEMLGDDGVDWTEVSERCG